LAELEHISGDERPELSEEELTHIIQTAFAPRPEDKQLGLLVDVPDETVADTPSWQQRREMVWDWFQKLNRTRQKFGLEAVRLFGYRNVHTNNADLPDEFYELDVSPKNLTATTLIEKGRYIHRDEALASCQILLAPTELSATAPLKKLAPRFGFRAATMPGFSVRMIPALRLDWKEIDRRVQMMKDLLDRAEEARITFETADGEVHCLTLDLRYRNGHASGGRFISAGTAGNLPSGESYIVPFEGDDREKSRSQGILPVQFGRELVLYEIVENRAVRILSKGPISAKEQQFLSEEPAYGNLAELGFGILADFGIQPVGAILLDEKLGLHIAFGRSDHFGGRIGPADFRRPENVIHIDRIYIPATQPDVRVQKVTLQLADGEEILVMQDGRYKIFTKSI